MFLDVPEEVLEELSEAGLVGENRSVPFDIGATATADFVGRLAGPEDSRLLVESSYDAFAREFGAEANLPLDAYRDGSAGFVPVREPVNRGYTVPPTGEEVPFDAVETGELRYGNGNPDADAYDSLTDVHVDSAGNVIEVRLPWILLNISDPSSKRRIATNWDDGLDTVPFESVTVSAVTFDPEPDRELQTAGTDRSVNLAHQIPGRDGSAIQSTEYFWDRWNQPVYEERLKQSYRTLRQRTE